VRAKDDRLLGPFTIAQATSLALVLVGVYAMQRLWHPEATALPTPAALQLPHTPA